MISLMVLLIGLLTAIACAIPGTYLVLRRMSMMSDAISHSVLPGIIIAFLIVLDRSSPFIILGAALSGLLMVYLTELISRSKLVKTDASIGLVFPGLFSIGVILISMQMSSVHFHEHSVLVGDITLSALNNLVIDGVDYGPKSLYILGSVIMINLLFIIIFFKELNITTFDPQISAVLGFKNLTLHYLFMTIVSITAVASFDAAGSILVIALFIVPAATAHLFTRTVISMIVWAIIFAIISSISGFYLSIYFDAAVSGGIAVMCGVVFLLTLSLVKLKAIRV
ncbi:MAG: zinc ABC transporter permease [Ignavibacteriae bacterium HGW-Ignavibacteriae-1]|nr:MAG: zinc ABC transporter permease [Ignavibacteriae bacterium HGW-Ignavibacteriae-1]